jgi:hypothetical protein
MDKSDYETWIVIETQKYWSRSHKNTQKDGMALIKEMQSFAMEVS